MATQDAYNFLVVHQDQLFCVCGIQLPEVHNCDLLSNHLAVKKCDITDCFICNSILHQNWLADFISEQDDYSRCSRCGTKAELDSLPHDCCDFEKYIPFAQGSSNIIGETCSYCPDNYCIVRCAKCSTPVQIEEECNFCKYNRLWEKFENQWICTDCEETTPPGAQCKNKCYNPRLIELGEKYNWEIRVTEQ